MRQPSTSHLRLVETTLLAAGRAAVLVEQPEGTLLRLVALAGQVLQGLATGGLLATADDATMLVLHQIGLDQTTGGVSSSAVENLGLGANSDGVGHSDTGGGDFLPQPLASAIHNR